MYCGTCGAPQPAGAQFCGTCGSDVTTPSTELSVTVPSSSTLTITDASPTDLLMSVRGKTGRIDLYPTKVTIRRKGMDAWILKTKGDKDIYLAQIASIQFRRPGLLAAGYIRFAFGGGQEDKGGVTSAVQDENAVTFTRQQCAQVEDLKARIEQLIAQMRTTPVQTASITTRSYADELERIAVLRDNGTLTVEEFEAAKRQILRSGA